MKRLKCPDCGGAVKITTNGEGHILGQCQQCGSELLLQLQGRQHIIVEHRLAQGAAAPLAAAAGFDRRKALFLGAAALVGGGFIAKDLLFAPSPKPVDAPESFAEVLFNKGGEGALAGQFRDHVVEMGIDSFGRALLIDNRNRFYIFGPQGEFIAHYALTDDLRGKFSTLLPTGEIILATHKEFLRLDLLSGQKIDSRENKALGEWGSYSWGSVFCPLPSGGFAAYEENRPTAGEKDKMPQDGLTLFGPDLRPRQSVAGLISQAIAPDPMVSNNPIVTSIALSPSGLIYLNIHALDDHDNRGGIYEYNGEGRLLRRIEIEQSWHGRILLAGEDVIYYGDPWRDDLQRISKKGRETMKLSQLASKAEERAGQISALALYPDGDLALATMNHRFLRLRPKPI